ncbi:MAG: C_GCAxxG_C_C family protein [Thermoguttaceae bacterium]|nr:C_GCAxxG_C_C family protein [Thermoguttaceae bacterium]
MSRSEDALKHMQNRNNCCQSVLLAFADLVTLPPDELKKLGAGFGGGMGCMEGTCGALCGAEMILGLARAAGGPVGREAGALHRAFAAKCGSSICKEIKGRDTGKVLCSCPNCVRNAADLLDAVLAAPKE